MPIRRVGAEPAGFVLTPMLAGEKGSAGQIGAIELSTELVSLELSELCRRCCHAAVQIAANGRRPDLSRNLNSSNRPVRTRTQMCGRG
jgi:hypothetical protein